jgi:hypothetical protein
MQRTVLALAICLSACMAESAQGPGASTLESPASGAPVCKDERATGSLMTRRVCRSPEQLHDEQMAKQTWMNHWPPNPLRGDPTYPGIDARHPTVTPPD